jgi:hypothetical protein
MLSECGIGSLMHMRTPGAHVADFLNGNLVFGRIVNLVMESRGDYFALRNLMEPFTDEQIAPDWKDVFNLHKQSA